MDTAQARLKAGLKDRRRECAPDDSAHGGQSRVLRAAMTVIDGVMRHNCYDLLEAISAYSQSVAPFDCIAFFDWLSKKNRE
jgi:hypothetical protein